MNTYVIRNMEDGPITLQFRDGTRMRLNSGQIYSCTGNSHEVRVHPMVDEGSIEVYVVSHDDSLDLEDKKKPIDFSWLKEGF